MNHTLKSWVLATRPWSFSASTMPVIVTIVWLWSIGYEVKWGLGLLAIIAVIFVHAAGNVWSDIFDYRKGVDAQDTYGVRLLVDKVFTLKEFLCLSISLNIIAVFLGLLMVYLTGPLLLAIGLAGILLSIGYPCLKYIALGDVVILLCYGFLPMIGTSYIVTSQVVWEVLWLSVSVGLITLAILHVNNVRDIATDRRAGIHTVPMLTGFRLGVGLYVFEVLFPFLWLLGLALFGQVSWWLLLGLCALPVALLNVRTILAESKSSFQKSVFLDEKTAQLHLLFCTLLVVGMLMSSIF